MSGQPQGGDEWARLMAEHLEFLLRDTRPFGVPVDIEQVSLVGKWPETILEVRLHLVERPATTYVLHTELSGWLVYGPHGDAGPDDRAGWLYDVIMEEVDSGPGLPKPAPGQTVVRVNLDRTY